jgi:hypothetical protein
VIDLDEGFLQNVIEFGEEADSALLVDSSVKVRRRSAVTKMRIERLGLSTA